MWPGSSAFCWWGQCWRQGLNATNYQLTSVLSVFRALNFGGIYSWQSVWKGQPFEATRMGIQSHDNRVPFQPVAMPEYRAPSFNVADPAACPTSPDFQAIALGPDSEFVWNAEIQKVVLRRGETGCLLGEGWTDIFFDTLLASVPIIHSEAGSQELQRHLRTAQMLEAGIFY
jgi:hypothetical protein